MRHSRSDKVAIFRLLQSAWAASTGHGSASDRAALDKLIAQTDLAVSLQLREDAEERHIMRTALDGGLRGTVRKCSTKRPRFYRQEGNVLYLTCAPVSRRVPSEERENHA